MNQLSPAVEVSNLTKSFGAGEAKVEALRGLNFSLQPGEFVSVMGPSGSGKSTLLHLIGGLDTPTGGRIRLGGDALDTLDDDRLTILRRQKIGFIFQAFNLLDVLTAEENVAVPLVVDGLAETEAQRRAVEALKLVGMDHRRHHRPGQLSGGEQQRIAIARALVTRPLLLLADEPTGNLDSANSEHVMTLLRRLATEGQTILMVTHNAQHAAQADRLVRLRDGVIVEEQRLAASRSVETVLADLEALP